MYCGRRACRIVVVASLVAMMFLPARAGAQAFEGLSSFTGCDAGGCQVASDGAHSMATLVEGPDGNFYGTTFGFPHGKGTIYRVTPAGARTTLVNFDEPSDPVVYGPWGCFPVGRLAVGADGFYGVTDQCGLYSGGTLFRLTFGGTFSVLHDFPSGYNPSGGLAFAPDGNLFGVTANGGDNSQGNVVRWDGASVTTVHSFGGGDGTGSYPKGDLTLASDGNIYGATTGGGGVAAGTLFRITPDDTVELFHTVDPLDGGTLSNGGLLQASDGHLYGTLGDGTGVLYRITLGGVFTPLHTGVFSSGNLIEGFGGVIYGTTRVSGTSNLGTVFRRTPEGVLTTLHSFSGADGKQPEAGLVRGANGHLYGTTSYGGTEDLGALFRLVIPPAVAMTANGSYGPVTLAPGDPLTIRAAFEVPGGGVVNPAHILIGFASPFGVYWLGPSGFTVTPAVLYSGPLPAFPLTPLFSFPSTTGLPTGSYHWFLLVVDGASAVRFDSVETIVPPGS